MSLVVGLDRAIALRLAAKGACAVQVGVVVDLKERFQRHTQPLGVMHHAVMMVRNAPWAGIDVQILVEFALLGGTAEFGVVVAAAQAPIAAAGAAVVLQHLHFIAGISQLVSGAHTGHAGAQNQDRGARRRTLQIHGTFVRGRIRKSQCTHGLVHGGTARTHADQAQQVTAADRIRIRIVLHRYSVTYSSHPPEERRWRTPDNLSFFVRDRPRAPSCRCNVILQAQESPATKIFGGAWCR